MTLQFRSRITSAIDYTKELTAYGVCCEHDMSPTSPNDPTPKNTFKQYTSTANKCYSDQNSESYITRTFYPNVDIGDINCASAADLGCCCSCGYAKQSSPTDYSEFLNDPKLLPFDLVVGEDKKCDINEYDIEIALHPEVGMRNGVAQCECARIGGVWKKGKCPIIESVDTEPDDLYDQYVPYYHWYWDESLADWVSRPTTGDNSKTQLIKTHCYKKDALTSTGSIDEPPPAPKGTCCISPIVYGDYKYCHGTAVTEIECQELADPSSDVGSVYPGRNGGYEWQASPDGEIVDCNVCLSDPKEGVCCPNSDNEFYGNPFKCFRGIEASLYDSEFGQTSDHPCANLPGFNPTTGKGYDYKENETSCATCPKKGLCCNDNLGVCLGLKFQNECISSGSGFRWVVVTTEQDYSDECGDNACNFPTGRCCVIESDRTSSCYGNVTEYQCEVEGIGGGPTGTWTQDQECGTDPDVTCGVGLCCDYANNICSGGKTIETCSGPDKVLHVNKTGAECAEVCHFNEGWCCSVDEYDTNDDGSDDVICHGFVTKNTCDNIRNTNRFQFTIFNNRDDENEGCAVGCPGFTNSLSICCEDANTPTDGFFETCVGPTTPGDFVSELECLFTKNGPDGNGDYTFTPRTNRKWYDNADACSVCETQTLGLCCDYTNNTCSTTIEATCTDPAFGGNANNEWGIEGGCTNCNFEGLCCYVEVGSDGSLIPKCEDDVKKFTCINEKQGIWNIDGTCATNGCGWGVCCNMNGVANAPSCQLARNGKLAGYDPIAFPNLSCLSGNFRPFTPGEISQAGNWSTQSGFTDPNTPGPAEKICSNVDVFDSNFNWFTTPIGNSTLFECKACNRLCDYKGSFCKDLNCGSGGVPCGPLSPGCECSYGTYDVYETVSNSRCGDTWKIGAFCDTCDTDPPSWSMQAIYEGGDGQLQEGEIVTVKLTGTGLNPTLGAFGITYAISAISGNISAADFSPSTPPNNGTFNFTAGGTERSSQFSLTTIADFTTEGDETFSVKTTSPILNLPITIKDTSKSADYKLLILDSSDTETTDFDLDERIDTFRKIKFTFGTNPPPSGSTYSWAITGNNITTGDFLSLSGLTGVFTLSNSNSYVDFITLTVNKDKVTEGQEDFTFTVYTSPTAPISQTFIIQDTAPAPTYNLTRDREFITEGANDRITFNFNVYNEDPGTTYTWAISGTTITAADLNLTSLSGAFTLANGAYTEWTESVGFTGATGDSVEGTETFTFTVSRLGSSVASISGNQIRETSNLSLDFIGNDNYYESSSLSTAPEGSFIRTRLKAINIPAGTTFPFRIYGPGITQSDIEHSTLSWDGSGFTGIFTIQNTNIAGGAALPAIAGYDTNQIPLLKDYVTDGGETFHVYLMSGPNLTTYSPTTGITSTNLTVLDWYKDPRIEYSFIPSQTSGPPDNNRVLSEAYSTFGPRGFTLTMKTFNWWNASGKTLIANITSWNGSNVTPNDFNGVWRTATSSSSTIGTKTDYLGLFNQIYGNTLLGITLLGPTGVYISTEGSNGNEGLTGLIQYFFEIKQDAITDIDPCSANAFEGFTFSVPSGQTLARPYSGPATLTGVTSNFIIYETSPAPTTANFIVYENDVILSGSNPTVTEDDILKIDYVVRNVCNASQLAVQIGGDITSDDIDFNSSSISEPEFNGCYDFSIAGTFALGTASNPIILVFNQDELEPTEDLTIKVYRNPCSAYYNSTSESYNYIGNDLLSALNIGIGDGAPPEPRGHCCNPGTGCRVCAPNGCLESECLPTETFTSAFYPYIGAVCPGDLSGGFGSCQSPPSGQDCSACCGKKKIWCCNPSTGIATNSCVDGPAFSCPAGQYEVSQESDCVKKVTCCNDFNNTCTIANENPGCLGAFERTVPYSTDCSVCNFDTVDPVCNLGAKFNYNVSWPVPINNNLAYNNSAFAGTQYPGSPIFDNENIINTTPDNMMEYLCSTAVCCGGNGESCVKKVYNWSFNGIKTSSGCGGQPDNDQNPLWGEQTQFYSACSHAAKNSWTPTTDLDGESTTTLDFYQKYIYNALNPNWTPHKCSNCSYGVCCKLDKNNGTTECLGSRVSRAWCNAKEDNNTDTTKVIRWISSYHQCKNIDIVSSDRQSITGSLTIPPYDCEICKEIVDLNYLYPGAWNQRDFWPGTLPKSTHVTACVNCKPEGDPSGGAPSGKQQGGGHDPLYERFQDYFNMNVNTNVQPFMKYQSLPDNFSSAKYTLDQNSTAKSCCESYRESPKGVQSLSSNFVISRDTQVETTPCICTNPDCICNFTTTDTCPGYDYDLCCDGCQGDPLGRCCNPTNGTCTEVTRGACENKGGIGWEANKPCDATSCERGACCQYLSAGGLDGDTTGCTEVARFECESPNQFSRGGSCPDACDGSPRPLGACCRYGVCSATTEEDCFLISPEKGGQYISWTNRPCDPTICEGTRPVACCKIDEPCSVRSRQSCLDYGGTVINEEGSCDGVECDVTPTWFCTQAKGTCYQKEEKGGYQDESTCRENCKNYSCTNPVLGNCTRVNGPGSETEEECQANCKVAVSYNCNGCVCTDPKTGNGTYTTFDACQTNCSTCVNCVNNKCVGGQYDGAYRDLAACEAKCAAPPLDTPGACCTYSKGVSSCAFLAAGSIPGTNELACEGTFGGVFFANKTCSEINCTDDVCCCGESFDGTKCFVCQQPLGWKGARCANSTGPCRDDNGNPTIPTSREECEGLP